MLSSDREPRRLLSNAAIDCRLQDDGCELVSALVAESLRSALIAAVGRIDSAGRRNLLAIQAVATFTRSRTLLDVVRPHVGNLARPVRAIWFNKSADANWLVAWHQDLAIAVRERVDVPGYGAWSVKEGAPHVQPPITLLQRMITVRVHLDDADAENGALRVIPGTHAMGRLNAEQISQLREEREETLCAATAGDALLMRPLLLHASGRSISERPRRVLHIEYAAEGLPGGLAWREPG